MNFSEYGNHNGKIVIYFHGAPGSPEEASIFDEAARKHGLHIICFDRFTLTSYGGPLGRENYYQQLSKAILEKTDGKSIDVLGFSIGCQAAIETGICLGDSLGELHLISAAASLDGANFIKGMAGEMVFTLAIKYPHVFTLLSYWQRFLAKNFPVILFKMLFASAKGEDKPLSKTADFQSYIKPILLHCFDVNVKGYIREINYYIKPWKESLSKINARTYIWHGTDDNWSPVGMANYLSDTINDGNNLMLMDGLSHYSCLHAAAPLICQQLEEL